MHIDCMKFVLIRSWSRNKKYQAFFTKDIFLLFKNCLLKNHNFSLAGGGGDNKICDKNVIKYATKCVTYDEISDINDKIFRSSQCDMTYFT